MALRECDDLTATEILRWDSGRSLKFKKREWQRDANGFLSSRETGDGSWCRNLGADQRGDWRSDGVTDRYWLILMATVSVGRSGIE